MNEALKHLACAAIAVAAFTATTSAAAAVTYRLTDLGLGSASALNERGQLTGSVDGAAFIWSRDTGVLSLGTFGGINAAGFDINDLGQVVGASGRGTAQSPDYRAFLYGGAAGPTIDDLAGPDRLARGINNSGTVVGGSIFLSSVGFKYSGGVLSDFGMDANAINNAGQSTGSLPWPEFGSYQVYSHSDETGFVPLGIEGFASAINSRGQIAGTNAGGGAGNESGFLYDPASNRTIYLAGAGRKAFGSGLNDSGDMVGFMSDNEDRFPNLARGWIYTGGLAGDVL